MTKSEKYVSAHRKCKWSDEYEFSVLADSRKLENKRCMMYNNENHLISMVMINTCFIKDAIAESHINAFQLALHHALHVIQ